jgi:hypothetical protein
MNMIHDLLSIWSPTPIQAEKSADHDADYADHTPTAEQLTTASTTTLGITRRSA